MNRRTGGDRDEEASESPRPGTPSQDENTKRKREEEDEEKTKRKREEKGMEDLKTKLAYAEGKIM